MNSSNEQRTLNWYRDRLGYITGSQVGKLMKLTKSGEFPDTAKTYLYQCAYERMLDSDIVVDDEQFEKYVYYNSATSKAMSYGSQMEAEARSLYSFDYDFEVQEVGAIKHSQYDFKSSPDGLILMAEKVIGVLEIKCPMGATVAKYMSQIYDAQSLKSVNPEYYWQCMAHMAVVPDAKFCDFVIYSQWTNPHIKVVTIHRDDKEIEILLGAVNLGNEFISNVLKGTSWTQHTED